MLLGIEGKIAEGEIPFRGSNDFPVEVNGSNG
jgi:hypothetical protein